MRPSGIGGQAVIEGVMMRNKGDYAVAVRDAGGHIRVEKNTYQSMFRHDFVRNTPLIRGVFQFVDSLRLGMTALTFAANVYAEGELDAAGDETIAAGGEMNATTEAASAGDNGPAAKESAKENTGEDLFSGAVMGVTFVLAFAMAIGVFVAVPYFLSLLFQRLVASKTVLALIEGVIRVLMFIGYVKMISLIKDIRRVYMYHGAEHKCINCLENGLELTVDNVRKSSKEHKRCGTSFLLFVVLISVIVGMFIRVDSIWLRLVIRLLLIPVVAGTAYELIRLAGRSNHPIVNLISRPGMWMQALTTKEPDDAMIEVGIASVEAVFDWRSFLAGGDGSFTESASDEKADAQEPAVTPFSKDAAEGTVTQ